MSERVVQRRKCQRRSSVWKYFKSLPERHGAQCSICSVTIRSCGNTTNLSNHLKRRHGVYDESSFVALNGEENGSNDIRVDAESNEERVRELLNTINSGRSPESNDNSDEQVVHMHTLYTSDIHEYTDPLDTGVTGSNLYQDMVVSDDNEVEDEEENGTEYCVVNGNVWKKNPIKSQTVSQVKAAAIRKQIASVTKHKNQILVLEKELMMKKFTAEIQLLEAQTETAKLQKENELLKKKLLLSSFPGNRVSNSNHKRRVRRRIIP